MNSITPARPEEYPEYFSRYIKLISEADACQALEEQRTQALRVLGEIDESRAGYRYATGKWTVREVIGHIIEVERMLVYWLWCFSRGDSSRRPSVDCEAYVRAGRFDARTVASLRQEYASVRAATLMLLSTLDAEALGSAGHIGSDAMTVRAIAYTIAGHELHHWQVLRDRYGVVWTCGSSS